MSELRRLYLFVSEEATVPVSPQREELPDNLGVLYPEPFTPQLSTWAFSARVLEALIEHAWHPTQEGNQLNIVLTPSLPEGEARVLEESAHFREVYVGLARATWLAKTVAEKRRCLIDLFVAQLAPMREAWSLDWPALQAAAKDVTSAYASILAPSGDATPVALGSALAQKLELSEWSKLTPPSRLDIARAVVERTRASGRAFGEPTSTTLQCGECVVRAVAHGIAFVLVPGGTLRRGFDEAQLARLDGVTANIFGDDELARTFQASRSFTPFGADMPCALDVPDETHVPAMWIADETCHVGTEKQPWEDRVDAGYLSWSNALAWLSAHRMTLPTSDELLWAASAGDGRLFPWGDSDAPIRALVGDGEPPQDAEHWLDVFDGANAFGLVAPLSYRTWCAARSEPDDAAPLVHVGGALNFAPWQCGWESLLFLTRVVSRHAFDGRVGPTRAMLRPVVRLAV